MCVDQDGGRESQLAAPSGEKEMQTFMGSVLEVRSLPEWGSLGIMDDKAALQPEWQLGYFRRSELRLILVPNGNSGGG